MRLYMYWSPLGSKNGSNPHSLRVETDRTEADSREIAIYNLDGELEGKHTDYMHSITEDIHTYLQ